MLVSRDSVAGVWLSEEMLPTNTVFDPKTVNPFGGWAVTATAEALLVPVFVSMNEIENMPPGDGLDGDVVNPEGPRVISPSASTARFLTT